MSDSFDNALERIMKATGTRTQVELATILGIKQSSISDAKKRKSVPAEWYIKLYRSHGLNPDWLAYGLEPVYLVSGKKEIPGLAESVGGYGLRNPSRKVPLCSMTKAEAEDAEQPLQVLGEMDVPESFYRPGLVVVQMDGASMEPVIRKGAYVGVDKDQTRVHSGEIFAVRVPFEGLAIRRLFYDAENAKLILRSENKDHPDQIVPVGKDASLILGRAIWVLQDL